MMMMMAMMTIRSRIMMMMMVVVIRKGICDWGSITEKPTKLTLPMQDALVDDKFQFLGMNIVC